MKFMKWFFMTNKDGENPAVICLSMLVGVLVVFLAVWGAYGFPALPITKSP